VLDKIANKTFANEADVETRLIIPLLNALEYAPEDIHPKFPVIFQEGRKGRRNEADFAVFLGKNHDRSHSLLVIEAKHPNEKLGDGRKQGESYAANLRSPFLILTNGVEFEVWQMQISAESELVFSASISTLSAKADELSSLAAKSSVQKYAEAIRRKAISEVNCDLTAYLDAELNRTEAYKSAIARRMYPLGAPNAEMLMSPTLLDSIVEGAVVTAPSGYGKTTLAKSLLRDALSRSKRVGSSDIAIEISLPEVAIEKCTILDFARNRISSHCAQVTAPFLRHLLRSSGGLFLLDGYDRLKPRDRDALLVQMKNLHRDFPATQIVVFSRGNSRPSLDVPVYELREYSSEEREAYIEAEFVPQGIHSSAPLFRVPKTLQALFAIPLLFHLAMKYWFGKHVFPTDLSALFVSWLDSLFEAGNLSASKRLLAEAALRVFARESVKGVLPKAAILPLLQRNGIQADILDDLIACDVLRMTGQSLEIVHEMLGDYLAACDITENDRQSLPKVISQIEIAHDSMLPVLLASMLRDRNDLKVLLSRLAGTDLPIYFEALRFRANISAQLSTDKTEFARGYLEDMLDGLEQPTQAFFEPLRDLINEGLAGSFTKRLSVLGNGSPDWINFQYSPLGSGSRVAVGPLNDALVARGSNLRLLGLRADSGRLLALSQLQAELKKLLENRLLHGGLEWRSERLVGWIRLLAKETSFPLSLTNSLSEIERVLQPYKGNVLVIGRFQEIHIPVDVLLADVSALRGRGDMYLNAWWMRFGNADENLLDDQTNTAALLDEFCRKVQLVYKQVVESNFQALRQMFGFYTSLPVRWNIAIPPKTDRFGLPWMQYCWRPVKTWAEAGAGVEFVPTAPDWVTSFDFPTLQEELRRLGRLTKHTHVWVGSSIAPRFDGRSRIGGYNGETAVMVEVCKYIKDDIERIFQNSPGADIPYSEIDRDTPWDFSASS
jgi:hypothetical protein